eukprot:m.18821 g.18821  ORF g.18821 m.18821 type:complete len:213 (+) comp11604_c0_seq1:336-974(+)
MTTGVFFTAVGRIEEAMEPCDSAPVEDIELDSSTGSSVTEAAQFEATRVARERIVEESELLRKNHAAARIHIDTELDKLIATLKHTTERRRKDLHEQLNRAAAVDLAAVDSHIAKLREAHKKQTDVLTRTNELAALSDEDLLNLRSELKSMDIMDLVPDAPPVPELDPVFSSAPSFSVDAGAIDDLCTNVIPSIGYARTNPMLDPHLETARK